jgi:hypothetical protein
MYCFRIICPADGSVFERSAQPRLALQIWHTYVTSNSAIKQSLVTFKVLTAERMKRTSLCDIAPCSLVEVGRHFRDAYCFHHQGDDEGSMHLWNVGLLQSDYTALFRRRLSSSNSSSSAIFLVFLKWKKKLTKRIKRWRKITDCYITTISTADIM